MRLVLVATYVAAAVVNSLLKYIVYTGNIETCDYDDRNSLLE